MLTRVTEKQYEDDGALVVRHLPTGNRYSTLPYAKPEDLQWPTVHGTKDRDNTTGADYSPTEIEGVALSLLRRKLAKRST